MQSTDADEGQSKQRETDEWQSAGADEGQSKSDAETASKALSGAREAEGRITSVRRKAEGRLTNERQREGVAEGYSMVFVRPRAALMTLPLAL